MTRDEAIEMLNKWGVLLPSEASEAIDMALDALKAEAVRVEIVSCKDCKHYSVKGRTTQFGFCGYRHVGTDETDYCSRAVRREP